MADDETDHDLLEDPSDEEPDDDDIADETPITRSIAVQAREAVAEADLVLFVVDAQIGITPGDEEVAQILREAHKPVLVIANKIDDPRMEPLALELHRLGLGDPIPISGLHGHGACLLT